MANISGTPSDEVLTGTAGADSIYGDAGNDVLLGLTGNNTLNGGAGQDIMVGLTGNDTYIVDNANDVISDTGGSDVVITTINYVLAAGIEKFFLDPTDSVGAISGTGNSSNNVITGNNSDNSMGGLAGTDTISGNAGNDTLDGGTGSDSLTGGTGNDTYIVDSSSDHVIEGAVASDTLDAVFSSASFVLSANVEILTLTGTSSVSGTGNILDNTITGNIGSNVIKGMAGNDVIDGGAGADVMYGGAGNDTFAVDNSADKVIELAGEGTADVVNATASFKMAVGAEIETLNLTGIANISGTGNALLNTINGNAGNNTLDGGLGADALNGGLGNDVYVVDTAGDVITDTGGNDTIRSTITIDLANYANIDNVTLLGAFPIDATGNGGVNILDGSTSAAVNILTGGGGDDTYLIDVHDTIVDSGGIDTMEIKFTFNLATSMATVSGVAIPVNVTGIENITLLGTSSINAIGDLNNNILIGNSGANTLDGADGNDVLTAGAGTDHLLGGIGDDTLDGGAGSDFMTGGAGNDTFTVDSSRDVVLETVSGAPGGTDQVNSSVSYNLQTASSAFGPQYIENLALTGVANINGTGNGSDNIIDGNSGNNTLDGGAGIDTLRGGAGNDVYIIADSADSVVETIGLSTVVDTGVDTIKSSVSYDMNANALTVDNLTLTGTVTTDTIDGTGNGLDNVITGNVGINHLQGGAGNDTYVLGTDTRDTVVDSAGASDTIMVGFTFDLNLSQATVAGATIPMTVSGIENITLTGTSAINATGDSNNNILVGNSGVNTLTGGDGSDTYVVNSLSDVVVEGAGQPGDIDTIQSTITYSLAALANIENLTLIGTGNINGTGNTGDNVLTGNIGSNSLNGGLGADILDGGNGNDTLDGGNDLVLADTMTGGLGNDTYIVNIAADVVTESTLQNEGIDTIKSSFDNTLATASYAFIENLTLTGTVAVFGTGNALENVITGNNIANTLDGGVGNDTLFGNGGDDILIGGVGNDTMNGGGGNDIFYVDSSSDVVIDSGGFDVVSSTATFTLPTGVEILTLTDIGGVPTDINGTGNASNNLIVGNTGDNALFGLAGNDTLLGGDGNDTLDGGIGSDIMTGGIGDDTYFVDSLTDHYAENPGEGTEDALATVFSVTVMPQNFENITLIDAPPAGGTTIVAVFANGDGNDNILIGNSLGNTLDGGGGGDVLIGRTGDDTLIGGSGVDLIAGDQGTNIIFGGTGADNFDLTTTGLAVIQDFSTAQGDVLYIGDILDSNFYTPGVSNINNFVTFTTVAGSIHVFVDPDGLTQPDGTGALPFTEVAVLSNVFGLTVGGLYSAGEINDLPLNLGI